MSQYDTVKHVLSTEKPDSFEHTFLTIEVAAGLNTIRTIEQAAHDLVKISAELEPRPENVAMYGHALIAEVGELMDELNWKRWKAPRAIDRERVVDEFADVLAFTAMILNMMTQLGITDDDLAKGFIAKSRRNVERLLGNNPDYKSAFAIGEIGAD